MEDITALTQLFDNYLFPVVVCAVLFIGIWKLVEMHKSEIADLSKVIDKNTDAINQMSITIQQISDRIDALERKEDKTNDV